MLPTAGGESRMIVLGEVPPSQPEQEQEPAQDVAAQWLQTEDQSNPTTTAVATTTTSVPPTASRTRTNVPPVPQPRQRIAKPDIRVPGNRNRKSRRRRITVAGNHTIHLSSVNMMGKHIRVKSSDDDLFLNDVLLYLIINIVRGRVCYKLFIFSIILCYLQSL